MEPKIEREKTMRGRLRSERGFALILTLVFMLTMTIIGLSVILNMSSDMFIARNDRDAKLAFQLAEAGLQEAMARIHLADDNANYIGEIDTDANYRDTAWNANNVLGKNIGCSTCSYNDANRGTADDLHYNVSIRYLSEDNTEALCDSNDVTNTSANTTIPPNPCDSNPPEIVMYGQDFNLDDEITYLPYGQFPVYIIRSTGTAEGGASRTVEAYVGASSLNLDSQYPINANGCIDVSGNSTTITDDVTGTDTEVMQLDGCPCPPKIDPTPGCLTKTATDDMDTYLGLPLAEVKGMADERHFCVGANCSDAADDVPSSGQIADVIQDWGDWAGDAYAQYIYVENPGREVVITGNENGRGLLAITGDMRISGSLNWEGLVYVMGTLTITGGGGGLNVDGGVMANGVVDIAGNIDVNYNRQILLDISKENSSQALILWRRL